MSKYGDAAQVLNSLTREGRAYVGSADDSALTDFVHTFFVIMTLVMILQVSH